MAHELRQHAVLSASGSHRWLECPPSALLELDFPDSSSAAAKEGTLAHELCEMKVKNYFYSSEFNKRKLAAGIKELKKNELWQDEMLGHTETYLDYIKAEAIAFESSPYVAIERKLDLSNYIPNGFGTADCILIGNNKIQIVDFKYGKGVPVSAEHNPQMMLYALGAYELYKILYAVNTVKLSIVQPRLDSISEFECSLEELLKFGKYAKERANLAIKGEGEFKPSEKTCRFCRAKARCKARAEENVKLAFAMSKTPDLLTNEEIGVYLKQGMDIAKWVSDLQDFALSECLAGRDIKGFKAVEGRSTRTWSDLDTAFDKLISSGISEEVLYEKKPLTLTQVEKTIGKTTFTELVGDLVVKPPGKPTLVEDSDKRPAITNKVTADDVFKEIQE